MCRVRYRYPAPADRRDSDITRASPPHQRAARQGLHTSMGARAVGETEPAASSGCFLHTSMWVRRPTQIDRTGRGAGDAAVEDRAHDVPALANGQQIDKLHAPLCARPLPDRSAGRRAGSGRAR